MKRIAHHIISIGHTLHVKHTHGGGYGMCQKPLCRFANWLHTSRFSLYPDTCQLCGKTWYPDFHQLGYQWTCDKCRCGYTCKCGSDDVSLDWEIPVDPNGELLEPSWRVECASCERRTAFYETAKEAADAWQGGEMLQPIPGTCHFEEVW